MLPSVVCREAEEALRSYLLNEYPVSSDFFVSPGDSEGEGLNILQRFLNRRRRDQGDDPDHFVKGPWLELKLPFRRAEPETLFHFKYLDPLLKARGFEPYVHQVRAFEKLRGEHPVSLLVATGTGSGKTECFLYPVLDYCLEKRGEPGIKAILLYPMNALASDQAGRLAALLWQLNHQLAQEQDLPEIRGGIYTGDISRGKTATKEQGPEHLVEDRHALRENPPDILITNYKMLDFLMMRPEDQSLWRDTGAESLRYLVVDELHSFDGAQGTDLACLIRRLRAHCALDRDRLLCVGTSATLGTPDNAGRMCAFATMVFGTEFRPEDIVQEDRLGAEEFLNVAEHQPQGQWPDREELAELDFSTASEERLLGKILDLWLPGSGLDPDGTGLKAAQREKLPGLLFSLRGFQLLVRALEQRGGAAALPELANEWQEQVADLAEFTPPEVEKLLLTLAALVSAARVQSGGRSGPFLQLRCQLWVRELRRLVSTACRDPELYLSSELRGVNAPLALPLISCRECHILAWGGMLNGSIRLASPYLRSSLDEFYRGWFEGHPDVRILLPQRTAAEALAKPVHELYSLCGCGRISSLAAFAPRDLVRMYFPDEAEAAATGAGRASGSGEPAAASGEPAAGARAGAAAAAGEKAEELRCSCGRCAREQVVVWLPRFRNRGDKWGRRPEWICPCCGMQGSLRIIGSRAASLTAVLTASVNSSRCNQDHKVLVFSDSVQDAALRAGFISARNYQFVIREALGTYLRETLKDNPDTTLAGVVRSFAPYWLERLTRELAQNPGAWNRDLSSEQREVLGQAAFVATFIPSDMQWRQRWKNFLHNVRCWDAPASGPEMILKNREPLLQSYNDWVHLYNELMQRTAWEALVELGMRSGSGRSLLRSCNFALYIRASRLKKAAAALASGIKEVLAREPGQENVPDREWRRRAGQLLVALLDRMRSRGAFDGEHFNEWGLKSLARYYALYMYTGNVYISFKKSNFLPAYFTHAFPPPIFCGFGHAIDAARNSFVELILQDGREWYGKILAQLCGMAAGKFPGDKIPLVYELAFKVLEEGQLVRKFTQGDNKLRLYALVPEHFMISDHVRVFHCKKCGRRFYAADELESFWEGSPCRSPDCDGVLERDAAAAPAVLPGMGTPVRVLASEHTSLIEGAERTRAEESFGKSSSPWSVNLLSATPTLEMGIDIGTLSTVVQSSVPPSQSSYIQRTGRAGRRDGNAFAVTFAGSGSLEQYYWQEPERMLLGHPEPPGIFMGAAAVLERQLTAFALDCWVQDNQGRGQDASAGAGSGSRDSYAAAARAAWFPDTLEKLIQAQRLGLPEGEYFPGNFLGWVRRRSEELFGRFIKMFEENEIPDSTPDDGEAECQRLTAEKTARLRRFIVWEEGADEPELCMRLNEAFRELRERLDSLDSRVASLDKQISKLKQDIKEQNVHIVETYPEVQKDYAQKQRKGLVVISNEIQRKNLLNFLCDEGLLPNYAFPEEGVKLNAVVFKEWQEKEKGRQDLLAREDDSKVVRQFDFTRPASQALRELAPRRRFYANQYVLHIDQLRLDNEKQLEQWRLCEDCAHAEKVEPGSRPESSCPCCGNRHWSDRSRIINMLRIREVIAHAKLGKDFIGDQEESRRLLFQECRSLVDFVRSDISSAWKIRDECDYAFGFEFLERAVIRELNFGTSGGNSGSSFLVSGRLTTRQGFKVCKRCGMLYKPGDKHQHALGCDYRDKPEIEDSHNPDYPWVDGIFLYHELKSEAIRIRVPVSEALDARGAESGTKSLVAALKLGLQLYFRGSVNNLRFTEQTEAAADASGGVKRYIVIYDLVPGGTGYLRELSTLSELSDLSNPAGSTAGAAPGRPFPEKMLKVFRLALDALENCSCAKDPKADGCYRCLYRFRDVKDIRQISRRRAVKILQKILQLSGPGAKNELVRAGSLRELRGSGQSVLEEYFISRLQAYFGADMEPRPDRRGSCYEINIPLRPEVREHFLDYFRKIASGSTEAAGAAAFAVRHFEQMGAGRAGSGTAAPAPVFTWVLRVQPDLSRRVPGLACRPDFVFEPRLHTLLDSCPQLCAYIFADGWEYHRGSLSGDFGKRQELLRRGFRVWSLSWRDVTAAPEKVREADPVPGAARRLLCDEKLDQATGYWNRIFNRGGKLDRDQARSWFNDLFAAGEGSFSRMLKWLEDPCGCEEQIREAMRLAAFSQTLVRPGTAPAGAPDFQVRSAGPSQWFTGQEHAPDFEFFWSLDKKSSFGCTLRADAAYFAPAEHMTKAQHERRRREWEVLLETAGVLQFLERFWLCTSQNEADAVYDEEPSRSAVAAPAAAGTVRGSAAAAGTARGSAAGAGAVQGTAAAAGTVTGTAAAAAPEPDEQWQEILAEMEQEPETFGRILPLAQRMQEQGLRAPDDFGVDAAGTAECSVSAGLQWLRRPRHPELFFFAREDLLSVPPSGQGRVLVLTDADEQWMTKLKDAL